MNRFKIIVALLVVALFGIIAYKILFSSETKDESVKSSSLENLTPSEGESSTISNRENGSSIKAESADRYWNYDQYIQNIEKTKNQKLLFFYFGNSSQISQNIEKQILENPSKIPEDTRVIKIDFLKNDEMRKKFEVSSENTIVQTDIDLKVIKRWNIDSYSMLLSEIQN